VGEQQVSRSSDPEAIAAFTGALLRDFRALEQMIEAGMIESGVRRFGAEQEMFLVQQGWRPAPVAIEVLETLGQECFTTEIGRFNLEVNLPPLAAGPKLLSELEQQLGHYVAEADRAARAHGAQVMLTGILPTLTHADLSLDNMTPRPRYRALNDAVIALRGGNFRLRIEGGDELQIEHDSVMLESCNTSCQIHIQVAAEEFALIYNVAQAMLAPVLAAAVNSPLLFGRRLWAETRIALFQQSIDTRKATPHLRELSRRVRFGDGWCGTGVLDLFGEDIARFRVIIAGDAAENPFELLERGEVPKLGALQLHNSTVYRWNRPCYGRLDGKAHLRIECRALPAGPTVLDEVANAALWIGLVLGGADTCENLTGRMSFSDARANFTAAARMGLHAGFTWLDGERLSAPALILDRLLPIARRGLAGAGVAAADIARYLGVIEERVASGRTGAQWLLDSAHRIRNEGTRAGRLAVLTAAMAERQRSGRPVHQWETVEPNEMKSWRQNYMLVEQCMTTDLFTVHEDEQVDLVAFLMDRQYIRQILVEDDQNRLVGIVSYRSLLRLLIHDRPLPETRRMPVREAMERDPLYVAPDTPTREAMQTMRDHRISALPVVSNGKLVGIISEADFLPIAAQLMEQALEEG
jgi:CBS domain-containing protein